MLFWLKIISFFAAGGWPGQPSALAIADSTDRMIYLENEYVKIGVNLDLGGSITYIGDPRKGGNIVNNHDWGRQIQMSFYSGPNPFVPNGKEPKESWAFLGWNPIQSGDWAGNRSKVIEHRNDGKQLYLKTIPMHWPLDNEPCECTFESWIQAEKNTVKVTARINNAREDLTQYRGRSQELPAIYTNAPFTELVTYTGPKPFTHDTVSYIENENKTPGAPIKWARWQATERWAATLNKAGWGLGVYNAAAQNYTGGFFGKKGAKGGSTDGPTAYMSPLNTEIIDHNISYTYSYVLILGTLDEIREYAYKAHAKAQLPDLPVYRFADDRQHWSYINIVDTGWPIKGFLEFTEGSPDAVLLGPSTYWAASPSHQLLIEAAYDGPPTKAKIYVRSHGQTGYAEENHVTFALEPGGEFRTYAVALNAIPSYGLESGLNTMTGLKFMPFSTLNGKVNSFRIKSIRIVDAPN